MRKKKCAWCRVASEQAIITPTLSFCSLKHAAKYAREKTKKEDRRAEIQLKKKWDAEKKKLKEDLKPKSKFMAEAQAVFNQYVRLRDIDDPCISCGKPRHEVEQEQGWKTGGCWDAGHFKSRGAKPQLRFNLWNVHKQCKKCNGGSGKFSHKAASVDEKYRDNLMEKIGEEKILWLENNNELRKFDIEYLKKVKRVFKLMFKRVS